MITVLTTVVLLTMAYSIFPDQIAVTSDGTEVRLKSDGTWSFVEKRADQPQRSKQAEKPKTAPGETSLIELVAADSASNFRSVKWYMTKEEVRRVEDATLKGSGNDTLLYELEMFGYRTELLYIFSSNRLIRIHCGISQPHSNPNRYFRDYQNLKDYLIPIYGSPTEEVLDWTNELYKEDESRWGFAASIGFLTYTTKWISANTRIGFVLSGRNHTISTTLEYAAINAAR